MKKDNHADECEYCWQLGALLCIIRLRITHQFIIHQPLFFNEGKACQNLYHEPAWKCNLILSETAWLLYSSTAFTASKDWRILSLQLCDRKSTTLGFCPFNTETHIKSYTEVERQNSIRSAQVLTHAEQTQNEFMTNLEQIRDEKTPHCCYYILQINIRRIWKTLLKRKKTRKNFAIHHDVVGY